MKIYKKILIGFHILILFVGFFLVAVQIQERQTKNNLFFIIFMSGLLNLGYYYYFRKRFIDFTNEVCRCTENILHNYKNTELHNKETLTSKMVMELEKIENIFQYKLTESENTKLEIQKIISEISHQLKTPISNIRMYQDMLSDSDINKEEADKFTIIIRQQLEKLEFLINSLVKSSRLESEMIRLNLENSSIFQTLAAAVNGIAQKAEKKKIELSVCCRKTIQVLHDTKWTAEAIENILDNAVKYTQEGGKISITVITGEMYTEIKIEDTGKGIEAGHFNDIFKRFYRETSVAKTEGLGLGLYLARNIITLQEGYISVRSTIGKGSCFSIFLPNRKLV